MTLRLVTVTNTGDEPYNGYDHGHEAIGLGLPPAILIEPGDSVDVTEAKAEQLKADHPDWITAASGRQSRGRGRGRAADADPGDDAGDDAGDDV
jgi:hypothetical protein